MGRAKVETRTLGEEAEMIAAGSTLIVLLVTLVMCCVMTIAAETGARWTIPLSGVLGVASVVGWVWAIQAAGSMVVP
jgi:hypothetical protein